MPSLCKGTQLLEVKGLLHVAYRGGTQRASKCFTVYGVSRTPVEDSFPTSCFEFKRASPLPPFSMVGCIISTDRTNQRDSSVHLLSTFN